MFFGEGFHVILPVTTSDVVQSDVVQLQLCVESTLSLGLSAGTKVQLLCALLFHSNK